MKIQYCCALILLCALVAGVTADESVPSFPHEFWGTVTIGGSPAPAGTEIIAMIGGTGCGSITTTKSGTYGSSSRYDGNRLLVLANEDQAGATITFLVDGKEAGRTATFTPNGTTCLDLSVGSAVTPTPTSSSGGNSGGGSGGGSSSPTVTAAAPRVYTGQASLGSSKSGEVLESVKVRTADGSGSVTVPAGTTALDSRGDPLGEVSVTTLDPVTLPPVPAGNTLGIALTCGPDGATFDPAVTLTFTLTEDEWAGIDDPATLTVFLYDAAAGTWQEVPATVDPVTRTVTARVSHFSTYALAWPSVLKEVTASAGQEAAAATTATPPAETQTPGETLPLPVIGAGCLILLLAVIGVYSWKKRG
ncbi:hypothetical protein [Methanofollis ethanolicus]|uniref:hypothetical protein n=1 Tax=Methanofollis ethanolicus TaxID=488124 RepID=UPI00082BCEC3|nr:hypothetical protein [Methanofollis ethanolicus]